MNPKHAAVISLFLALALVAGLFSVLRTTQLGAKATAPTMSSAQITAKNRQLARYEAQLRAAAAKKPPALPALPAAGSQPVAAATAAAAPQRVVYVRPAPIVHVVHRHGGEHENEHGDGGGLDD